MIAEVTGGNPSVTRRLLWDLQNQPGLLTGQAHHHGPKTLLLVNRLHEAGAHGVPAPKCPHGDRAVRLSHSINRLRVCGTCYNHAKAEPCKWCGRTRPVAGRDDTGAPICNTCRNKEPSYQEECVVCGRVEGVAARTTGGPICAVCRKPPVVQCGSCGKVRACLFAWTDSPRCRTCSTKLEPCTDCERPSRVVARTARGPICENSWEKAPEAHKPCKQCGTVERLFHFGLCRRCAADRQLRKLLTAPDGKHRPDLDKVAAALLNLNPRRTLLYLRDSPTATRLVTDLAAGSCELTHEALDARMTSQKDMAVDYFRAVMVSAGVLPVRDEYMARLERWIEHKAAAIEDLEHRRLITAYARWDRIARIRRRARGKPISAYTSDIAQAQIAKAVAFLTWIKEQGETLATCRQSVVDLWLTSENHQGPYDAGPFVRWAVRSKFAPGISIPARPRRIFHRPLDADERWATARRLLNDDSIETRDRVAGLMVLLYGQYPARTCRLTTAHVIHDETGVALRLNRTPLRLPPPLDSLVLQLVDIANDHQHAVMSNDLNAPWLFPTQRPGKPLGSKQLSRRLRKIGLPTEAGRCAALLDLCTQMPPAVLQRLLGISSTAAERWAAGAVRSAYAAEVARRSDG
ncbi:site-specific integrase [Streptomyces sp. Mg1]|uniref:site-specific integrase n=1 Tax=Streptomyces sp. Mg1 TaxID=465541 RepID=UPI001F349BF8|nr:site-specific integrase [Streptomyces sp. Mg1]